jgi:hypothetical protein
MNTPKLMQLKTELKKFGLNPADWKVLKIKPSKYKIANVKDHSFYFLGEAQQDELIPRWNYIRLVSF